MSGLVYKSKGDKRPVAKETERPKVLCDLPPYSRLATYKGKLLVLSEEGSFEITPRGLVEITLDK